MDNLLLVRTGETLVLIRLSCKAALHFVLAKTLNEQLRPLLTGFQSRYEDLNPESEKG